MVVCRGQGFQDVFDHIDRLQSFQIRGHHSVSLNLLARSRNLVNKNWHLLASAWPLVERPCEQVSNLVGNNDSEDNWDEYWNTLGRLHHDDRQRVGHPGVASEERRASKYHKVLSHILVNVILEPMKLVHAPSNDFANCTSYDHSRQEKSCWHIDSIRNGGHDLPDKRKHKELGNSDFEVLSH